MAEPNSEHVVDETAVDEELVFKPVEDHVLVQGIKNRSPRRCRRSPHRSTSFLLEPAIPEAKDVVSHHQFQRGCESLGIVVFPTSLVIEEVLFNETKGRRCWYVSIHRDRVAREQACVGWDLEPIELAFEIVRAFEEAGPRSRDGLEHVVDVHAQRMEEAAAAGADGSCLHWCFVNLVE